MFTLTLSNHSSECVSKRRERKYHCTQNHAVHLPADYGRTYQDLQIEQNQRRESCHPVWSREQEAMGCTLIDDTSSPRTLTLKGMKLTTSKLRLPVKATSVATQKETIPPRRTTIAPVTALSALSLVVPSSPNRTTSTPSISISAISCGSLVEVYSRSPSLWTGWSWKRAPWNWRRIPFGNKRYVSPNSSPARAKQPPSKWRRSSVQSRSDQIAIRYALTEFGKRKKMVSNLMTLTAMWSGSCAYMVRGVTWNAYFTDRSQRGVFELRSANVRRHRYCEIHLNRIDIVYSQSERVWLCAIELLAGMRHDDWFFPFDGTFHPTILYLISHQIIFQSSNFIVQELENTYCSVDWSVDGVH